MYARNNRGPKTLSCGTTHEQLVTTLDSDPTRTNCVRSVIGCNPFSGSASYTETVLESDEQCRMFDSVKRGRQVEGIEKCALTFVNVPVRIVHDIKL